MRGPFPSPFPKGKGAGRLMAETVFQVNVSFEDGSASPPWGRLGDGHFPAKATNIHPSAFIIHPCSLGMMRS